MGIPVLLGFTLAFFWPYLALDLGSFSIFFLALLMLATTLLSDWHWTRHWRDFLSFEFYLALFLGFLLIPSLVWALSFPIHQNQALDYGLFWAALCPVAIVAPQFSPTKADKSFSFSIVVGTALLFPFFAFFMNHLFYPSFARLQIGSQLKDMLFLSTVPVALGMVIRTLMPRLRLQKFRTYLPMANMILIGILSYTYMGAALQKISFSNAQWFSLAYAIILAFLLDFGIYFALPVILKSFSFSSERKESIRICLSMKNVAIAGGILLFEFPVATLASGFVFFAHSFLFTFLGRKSNFPRSS